MGILRIAFDNFNRVFQKSVSEPHINPQNWLDKTAPQDHWDDHLEASILKDWAGEIIRATESQGRPWWELAGTNIVVAQEDQGDLREVLRLLADALKVQAAFIPAGEINQILPDIRSFLAPIAPALVMLEGGSWCADGFHDDDPFSNNEGDSAGVTDNKKSIFSEIADSLKHFDPQQPIFLLLGLRNISNISDALCQCGAFDRFIVVGNKPREKLAKQFCDAIGEMHVGATLSDSPGKLGMLVQNEFQTKERRELAALQLTRLAHKLDRKIEFSDVVDLVLRGFVEFGSEAERQLKDINRRKTACHEAGHAAIAILESGGRNIPEYASIIPARNFAGVVLESLDFIAKQNEFTFSDLLLKVRVSLAGRAAEEFFFSSSDVSSGADSDLSYATNIAFHFFAFSGFHRNMDQSHFSGKNLAVMSYGSLDAIQCERINSEVRLFLAEQYEQVLSTLKIHQPFVASIADRLMWDPVVDQLEMIDICREFGIYIEPAQLINSENQRRLNVLS